MNVAIILLAAGKSSRTSKGGFHKLLAEFDGIPLLQQMATVAMESDASSVTVVLGHRHEELRNVLSGIDVETVVNPDYALGMSSSLAAGLATTKVQDADGVMIMLADMPGITSEHLNEMIFTFKKSGGTAITRAVANGSPGNPVILPRSLREAVSQIKGDVGARDVIKSSGLPIINVEVGHAAEIDVDTPEAIAAAGGMSPGASRGPL
ncbi:nucleotidyltransferase family protein [Agrobacterium rosae]|uniref:nucleotidyltransferase family protein n=1 Tax=Agrobacterium rosae TaxID=1972867 RepID=UPI000CD9ADD5|nr:nucleotidyltransferase family protein [Agrobacterium rosae]POO55291.1 molybdopterin-guanine dinucleotide biosynthesis protein MobA [Agrobacterium rosae]